MKSKEIKMLEEKLEYLKKCLAKAEARSSDLPEGSLIVKKSPPYTEYYHSISDKANGKMIRRYLRKDEEPLAHRLAQKSYDHSVIIETRQQIKLLEDFLGNYEEDILVRLYNETHPGKRELIDAFELSDEEYVKQWEAVTYPAMPFENDAPEFFTQKGERVRSKSEIIIADMLLAKKIPYRYEPLIRMMDGSKKRPDFVVLNVRKRREYMHEHLGMMDNPVYIERNMKKIKEYISNGYFPGEDLILTVETSTNPLSTSELEKIIEHYYL